MKKLKILQINPVYGVGSTGGICADIEQELESPEFEFYMAYSTRGSTLPKRGFLFGSRLEKKIHALASRITGLQGYFSQSGMRELIEFMEVIKPDIVHLHNLHSNDVNLPRLFQYLIDKKIKVVLTLHDCWPFTGKCTHYYSARCTKWMESCGGCPKLAADNPSWFFDRTEKSLADKKEWYRQIDSLHVIAVSDWIYSEAQKSILSSAKSIARIYNWIDTDVFAPRQKDPDFFARLGLNKIDFTILSVASEWNSKKGLDFILELAAQLPTGMQYLLVGKLPKNLKLPNTMVHVERLDNASKLAKFYSNSDVFLNASAEESFGKVTAEAISSGIPVMGLSSTATTELISPGTGHLLESLNISDVQKMLQTVRENGRDFYKEACRRAALEKFRKTDILNEYRILYKGI